MGLKKIVNIMPDEKFLDYFITMSERFIPGQSSYVVLTDKANVQYIKAESEDILVSKYTTDDYQRVVSGIPKDSVIVFHSFNYLLEPLINSLPKCSKKIWLFWGEDGYRAIPRSHYLGFQSNRFIYNKSVFGLAKFVYSRLKSQLVLAPNIAVRNMIRQMDYCATWVDADYVLAKKYNPEIKRLNFSYFTKELMKWEDLPIQAKTSHRILLGNSGAATNNHVEALKYLHEINYKGNIICPLSYGGQAAYVKNVCALGLKLFAARFIPLTDFMPLHEYQDIINGCDVVWMNHKRQQAAGNLLTAFLVQKMVITDAHNPLNSTFRSWGLRFFDKETLEKPSLMSTANFQNNRKIVLERLTIKNNKDFFTSIHNLA